MSIENGLKALNLEMPDRIPQTEFIDHDDYLLKTAGVDTRDPEQRAKAWPTISTHLDFDVVWNQHEMPMEGRFTKLGHAVWNETNDLDTETFCQFNTVEEVLEFDPVKECVIRPHEEIVKTFKAQHDEALKAYPTAVVPGGRYHSLFSNCIRTFGWELFMYAARVDEKKFDKVLEGFAEITLAEIRAWCALDIPFFLMHDDIVWTSGPVFAPEWYRKYIFPRFKRYWDAVHEAGKKIIFCSDGTFNEFIDDIARAGADGFIFEPTTSLETIAERYGKTHVIIGNADCRVLQFGDRAAIRKEVERCVNIGRDCPGFIMCASNHLPNGIPTEHVEYYMEVFNELRYR